MSNTKILYLECDKRDFREFLVNNPGYHRRLEDGRIDFTRRVAEDPPWLYVKGTGWQNCILWHQVLFKEIHKQKRVPVPCQSCWKVVLMPRNLEELIAAWIMQQEINRPCKCGTEGDRDNTDRLYGAYWYNHSQAEGLDCYRTVKAAMEKKTFRREFLGVPLVASFGNQWLPADQYGTLPNLILKRGCTEMEQACGPSDQWDADEDQHETEEIVMAAFSPEIVVSGQSDFHVGSILKDFIHRAFKWGDKSYLTFTNGNRLFPPPVTYHNTEGPKDGKECSGCRPGCGTELYQEQCHPPGGADGGADRGQRLHERTDQQ